MGMQNPVEAALRADVDTTIGQNRHDLPGRQRRKFRLVCPVSIRLMGGVNLVDRWNQAP
jgi:hypothetical protein